MQTANSGFVVELSALDFQDYEQDGPLAGLNLQRDIERSAWELAGKTQKAPAQRLIDFVKNKQSETLPKCSYTPGIVSVRLSKLLPKFINDALVDGFIQMGKSMKGFLTNDAIVVGPESRTSSPVRIPRDPKTSQHIEIWNLYPSGEGAGYAGGIMSAAIDGMNMARSISKKKK